MFYEQLLLTRKGALANIWLAAHWDKKLSKIQIENTDLVNSIDSILAQYLALRLSGHLLLGAAKIYNKKIFFLFGECKVALLKIKTIFKPALEVDLEEPVAALTAITLPQNFGDIEIRLPENIDSLELPLDDKDVEEGFSLFNIRSKELISLEFNPEDIDIFPYLPMADDRQDLLSQGLFSSQIDWDIEQQRRQEDLLASVDRDQSAELSLNQSVMHPDLHKINPESEIIDGFELPPAIELEHDEHPELSVMNESRSSHVDLSFPLLDEHVEPPKNKRPKRSYVASFDKSTQLTNECMNEVINNTSYFHNEEFEFAPINKVGFTIANMDLEKDMNIQFLLKNHDSAAYDRIEPILNKIVSSSTLKDPAVTSDVGEKVLWDLEKARDRLSAGDERMSFSNEMPELASAAEYHAQQLGDSLELELNNETPYMDLSFAEDSIEYPSMAQSDTRDEEQNSLNLSENTNKIRAYFKYWADSDKKVYFLKQCEVHKSTKRQVAQAFFGILEMVTKKFAAASQTQPWGEIAVEVF